LVSQISAAVPASPPAADTIKEITPVDGGMGSWLAGGATVIAPAPQPPDPLVVPLVGTAKAVGPTGPMVMAAGFSESLDVAVERVVSVSGTGLRTTREVGGNDSGTNASAAPAGAGAMEMTGPTNAELARIGSIAMTSGPNEPPVMLPPMGPPVDFPGPAAAASLAGSGGMFVATEQEGASSSADGPQGVQVTMSYVAVPLLPAGILALLPMGIIGHANFTFGAVGGGNGLPVEGFATMAVETDVPLFIWSGANDAAIQASLPAPAVATPGAVLLAPLLAMTGDVSLRVTAGGANAPGAVANWGNAATVFDIGAADPAAFGPSKAIGNACRVLARDSALAVGAKGLAAMVINRDIHDWRNPDVVDTVMPDPRQMRDPAGPLASVSLAPQQLGLIVDLRPFDRVAVEQTIDQFFQQLDLLGAGLASLQPSMDVAAELLALAIALTAWFVVPKVLRRPPGEIGPMAYDDATSLDGISGLAGGTSQEES
jgi:hypothetical protein